MKTLSLFFLCSFFSLSWLNGQTPNAQAIDSLEVALQNAIVEEDYEKAAFLKKQKEIRTEIQAALEAGNYEKAADLKRNLKSKSAKTKDDNADESLLYFYASKSVGAIGGYVNLPDGEKIEIAAGDIKKVAVPAGEITLATNTSESAASITRTLKPNHIYFIQFSSVTGVHLKRPDIYFVSHYVFDSLTGYQGKFDPDFKLYEPDERPATATLKIVKEKNFNGGWATIGWADVLINGEPVIRDYSHKNFYEVAVPEGELDFTLVYRIGYSLTPSAQHLFNIESGETKYLKLETRKKMSVFEFGIEEIGEKDFNKIAKSKTRITVP